MLKSSLNAVDTQRFVRLADVALAAEVGRGCCLSRVDTAGARVVRSIDKEVGRISSARDSRSLLAVIWRSSGERLGRRLVYVHHVLVVAGGAGHESLGRVSTAIGHREAPFPWAAGDRRITIVSGERCV